MTNYQKGARFERKLVNEARAKGLIAFRSAGSHSLIDICIINKEKAVVEFIQCKKGKLSKKNKKSISGLLNGFKGYYWADFRLENEE